MYLALCDVLDGDGHRFEELKRVVLTLARECMLYERIKNAIDSNCPYLRMWSLCLFRISESKTWIST